MLWTPPKYDVLVKCFLLLFVTVRFFLVLCCNFATLWDFYHSVKHFFARAQCSGSPPTNLVEEDINSVRVSAIRYGLTETNQKKSCFLCLEIPIESTNCPKVPLKEISAYLTLLEGGKPEDKLECEFFLLHKSI